MQGQVTKHRLAAKQRYGLPTGDKTARDRNAITVVVLQGAQRAADGVDQASRIARAARADGAGWATRSTSSMLFWPTSAAIRSPLRRSKTEALGLRPPYAVKRQPKKTMLVVGIGGHQRRRHRAAAV